jgi:hypothetical protein
MQKFVTYDNPLLDFDNGGPKNKKWKVYLISASADEGPRFWVCARGPFGRPPPSTLAEIFRRTCLQSHFFEISPFSGQNRVISGGPRLFLLLIGILIFLPRPLSEGRDVVYRWQLGT